MVLAAYTESSTSNELVPF